MRGWLLFIILLVSAPATASAGSLGDVALEVFNSLTGEGQVVRVETSSPQCEVRMAAAGWVKQDCEIKPERERKKSL